MNEVIVDLGCGTSKVSGAIGIDRLSHPGVNIISDFETSLPLKSDSVDTLHVSHVIEHIANLIPFMEGIYRVCKPGASVYITSPYYTSRGAYRPSSKETSTKSLVPPSVSSTALIFSAWTIL